MNKTTLDKLCEYIKQGKGIPASKIKSEGLYPVYGANGVRGYTDTYNFDGSAAIIGRQGEKCGNVKYFSGKAFMSEHAIVAKPNNKADARYIAALLSLLNLRALSSQSAQPGISVGFISKLPINIPEIGYQNKVSHFLKFIDDLFSDYNMLIQNYEHVLETIFSYYFLQFDFPDENGNPYKASGGKMIYSKHLKMEIPARWEVKTVGDIIIEKPKSKIQINQVSNNGNNKIPFFTSGEDILKVDKPLVSGKHLFLSTGGNSHVSFYFGDASYSTDTWCLTTKNNLEVYFYEWIRAIGKYMNIKFFSGTGLKHLQKDLFKKEFILVPDRFVLEKFNKYAYIVCKNMSSLYLQIEELKSLRDFLLPLLMNGQVTIRG